MDKYIFDGVAMFISKTKSYLFWVCHPQHNPNSDTTLFRDFDTQKDRAGELWIRTILIQRQGSFSFTTIPLLLRTRKRGNFV